MNNKNLLHWMSILILVMLLLSSCGSPLSEATNTPIPPAATNTPVPPTVAYVPLPPKPGRWLGTAEFGTFIFTVNPQGTGVPFVEYTFNDYNCGGAIQSGSIGNGQETGWDGVPISDGKFTFEGSTMTLQGTFESDGVNASGTWTYPQCSSSGKWTATPSQ